jgi:anti-sigma factor RsiW
VSFSCVETEARLVDVVDGRLDPPLEMRVHAHLEECARCRQKAELWRALVPRMRALMTAAPLGAEAEIDVAAGGDAELAMERGSRLRLHGPARLTLGGTPGAVALRLAGGTLDAEVAHRLPGETFAVATADLRVDVRGTRFVVAAGAAGSVVRVLDGLVAVAFSDGSARLVGAGESAGTAPEVVAIPPSDGAPAPAAEGAPALEVTPVACGPAVRSCQAAARSARQSMRGGGDERALRLVGAASRSARDAGPACARELSACQDELGYLGAEALRGAGRVDEAIGAFRALNRPGAPAAMRQNALYAAAELARARGRTREARADYESALAVAPHGALREEAVIGSMESADALGDRGRAAALARIYLGDFPDGRDAPTARRLLSSAPRP